MAGMSTNGSSSSSWMVEMEKLLEDTRPSVEMARWKQLYIYRVPEFIKKMTNRDAYQPQFVSLGPLHHGEPHLMPIEEHKRRAVLHMVKRARKPLMKFVEAIEEVADELEAAYDGLEDRWRGASRGSFVEMMVTDGCFLLELMRIQLSLVAKDDGGGEVDTGYVANDHQMQYLQLQYFQHWRHAHRFVDFNVDLSSYIRRLICSFV